MTDAPPRWQYRHTWTREAEEGDADRIAEILDNWSAAGWELVSANAIQVLSIQTGRDATYDRAIPGFVESRR